MNADPSTWADLPEEQRTLAVFAHVMANADEPKLQQVIAGSRRRLAATYRARLTALGAEWLGKAIQSLSMATPGRLSKIHLLRQCARISAEREALWASAIAYALAHDALPLRVVR